MACARLLSVIRGICVVSVTAQSQSEGKHSPVFVSCYLPPHVMKSICMTCFDALRDPDGVTIVSICPIVTRIDRIVVIFTPHMSVAWCGQCPGVGVRGYCRSLRVTRQCCYSPDSITPTLQHPAINYIGCRHGENRDVSSKQHGYLDNMKRRQKRCFHLLIYVFSVA